MKRLLFLFLPFIFFYSCSKSIEHNSIQPVSDENWGVEEYDDEDSYSNYGYLEVRAVDAPIVRPTVRGDTVQSPPSTENRNKKYVGQFLVDLQDGSNFSITAVDVGFGTNEGTVSVRIGDTTYTPTIEGWGAQLVEISFDMMRRNFRNGKMQITITRNDGKVIVCPSVKVVAAFRNPRYNVLVDYWLSFAYGSMEYELMLNRRALGLNTNWGVFQNMVEAVGFVWLPAKGQILKRNGTTGTDVSRKESYAVIYSLTGGAATGYYDIVTLERDLKGTGSVQKKNYRVFCNSVTGYAFVPTSKKGDRDFWAFAN
jgi:hypothetical protein